MVYAIDGADTEPLEASAVSGGGVMVLAQQYLSTGPKLSK